MKKIVILGGGFAGLQTALNLAKNSQIKNGFEILLVDKKDYQLFTPNLYEAAVAEEELVSVAQVKKSITIPYTQVFKQEQIKFVQGEVKEINVQEKKLVFATKQINYDYLVIATGSASDYYGVEGAEKFALPLKSLPDAFRIRNRLEFEVDRHSKDFNKKSLRVVVAGGGYTGLEFAGELKGLMDILALKYNYPREKIEIEIIEANSKLVMGFDPRLSDDAYTRLSELGIKISLAARISQVEESFIYLMSGEKIAYDCLVWATGVKAAPVECNLALKLDAKGKICVNEFLQVQNHSDIFAVGDTACVFDSQNRPVPPTAQNAWHQARYIAYALPILAQNHKPKPYTAKKHGFIVNLGGKWAIMSYGQVYLKGFLAWFVDQCAHVRYYSSVVGWWKSIKYIFFQIKIYSRND